MSHIALIACASQKREDPAPARDLYESALFRKSLAYAEEVLEPDAVFVLSAEHHLLPLDQEVAPYDETLNNMSADEVRAWSKTVLEELEQVADPENDRFTILAGQTYRKHLTPHLSHAEVPMEGLRIGEQLRFLNEAVDDE
jgi:hypothetical protein